MPGAQIEPSIGLFEGESLKKTYGKKEGFSASQTALPIKRAHALHQVAACLRSRSELRPWSGSQVAVRIPWEPNKPGQRGQKIAVVGHDAANKCHYPPVDFDNRLLLAINGLSPTAAEQQSALELG